MFTGVCAQHVETFGSEENILKGKSEIVKSSAKKIVCGGELKEKIAALFLDVLSMSEKECLYADYATLISDLKLKPHATSFTLCLPDTDAIAVEVPLLGKHSAENVALAALLAREMGLTGEEIARGIEGIRPVPHRLQLIEGDGVYILDDSYNANPRGAREAVEALSVFPRARSS
ncbi:MAG: Mur ligase family protein [Christensenellaceae bacterium]